MDASIFDSIGVIISIRKSSVTADGKQQCSCRDLDVNKKIGRAFEHGDFQIEVKRKRFGEKKCSFLYYFFLWMLLFSTPSA